MVDHGPEMVSSSLELSAIPVRVLEDDGRKDVSHGVSLLTQTPEPDSEERPKAPGYSAFAFWVDKSNG